MCMRDQDGVQDVARARGQSDLIANCTSRASPETIRRLQRQGWTTAVQNEGTMTNLHFYDPALGQKFTGGTPPTATDTADELDLQP